MTYDRGENGKIVVDGEFAAFRWTFPDPRDPRLAESLCKSALDYLLYVCPTTKDAMKKLADMRRGVRALPPAGPR